ncbi:MAG: hypothetical protein H7144_08760 [Burkholderiales bacterium]|nr:hypothetical protein [Phycisphaerae bacterium]
MPDEPKALYQVKSRAGMSSHPSGLEELAEVVHSSGLSGSGMLNRPSAPLEYATPGKKPRNAMMIVMAIAVSVLVLLAIFMGIRLLRSGVSNTNTALPPTGVGPAVSSTPSFANVALNGDKIAYVIDRGDATAALFPGIKTLTTRSVRSLGPERRFTVILWNNGSDDAFPNSGTVFSTSDEAGKLGNWLDNVSTGRATSVDSALANALAQSPKEIVLITAKADQLDPDEFAATVLKIRAGKPVKIHTFSLGSSPDADPLKKIAADTGGIHVRMSAAELNNFSD